MSLEEEVEEGFLTRFGRWAGKKILPFTFPLVFGCSEDITGPGNEKPKQEVIVNKSKTNTQGKAYFEDSENGNNVIIQVVDINNNSINKSNLDITYDDCENVEAFFLKDSSGEYLPSKAFFEHNSSHTLKTGKSEDFRGIFHIDTIKNKSRGKLLVEWKGDNGYGWTVHRYLDTFDKDEKLMYTDITGGLVDLVFKGLVYYFSAGKNIPFGPSKLFDLIPEKNDAERWDVYLYSGKDIVDGIDFIPSNVPTLTLSNPKINDDDVNISWRGNDKTTYEHAPIYFPTKEDPTILLGRTKNSDLTYFYRVNKDGKTWSNWASTTKTKGLEFIDLEDGDYTLYAYVKDEVGNQSDVKNVSFSIKENSKQEELFNILDYMILTKGSAWYYNNSYYNRIVDVVDYNGKKLVVVENPRSGEYWQIKNDGIYLFGVNIGKTSSGDLYFNPPVKIGSKTINLNDNFLTYYDIYSDPEYTNKVGDGCTRFYYINSRDITVPAGTFKNCLIVQEQSSLSIDNLTTDGWFYHYLAKDVGEVKFEDSNKNIIYELKSYNVK